MENGDAKIMQTREMGSSWFDFERYPNLESFF